MKTYGIIFKEKGKVYYFNYDKEDLNIDDEVIVETDNGEQLGKVHKVYDDTNFSENIKMIVRKVTKKDLDQNKKNIADAAKALEEAKKLASKLNLKMNFIDAKFSFDRKQLLFNFLADERIDFRELAKSLAGIYKTRIELRQVGVRDKAKEVGGV